MTNYKLVPVEPTPEMINAARSQSSFPLGVYRAMLAAAPAVQGEPDGFREIVEAVAHIGVDFGYGNFDLSQEHIEKARALLEAAPQPAEQQPLREQVPVSTSAQEQWDYYQTLLKQNGFDGITDLLVKYRKLAEQVSAVPDVSELVEALEELVVLMEDTHLGEYTPDSFTSQPARVAIASYRKGGIMSNKSWMLDYLRSLGLLEAQDVTMGYYLRGRTVDYMILDDES